MSTPDISNNSSKRALHMVTFDEAAYDAIPQETKRQLYLALLQHKMKECEAAVPHLSGGELEVIKASITALPVLISKIRTAPYDEVDEISFLEAIEGITYPIDGVLWFHEPKLPEIPMTKEERDLMMIFNKCFVEEKEDKGAT